MPPVAFVVVLPPVVKQVQRPPGKPHSFRRQGVHAFPYPLAIRPAADRQQVPGPLPKIAADLRREHFRAVKAKLLRLLSVLGLIFAALASLDLTGITAVLPPEYAGKALAAGLLIAALRDAVLMFGDLADDGKRNNSWQPVVAWLAVPVFLLALPSC